MQMKIDGERVRHTPDLRQVTADYNSFGNSQANAYLDVLASVSNSSRPRFSIISTAPGSVIIDTNIAPPPGAFIAVVDGMTVDML